jgi:hypothetical protein
MALSPPARKADEAPAPPAIEPMKSHFLRKKNPRKGVNIGKKKWWRRTGKK